MLARLLVSGGNRVREYLSGAELIAAADQPVEGCILLDVNMLEADDLTLLAWKGGHRFCLQAIGRGEIVSALNDITTEQFVATAP